VKDFGAVTVQHGPIAVGENVCGQCR